MAAPALRPGDVRPGKCFVTGAGETRAQVRRVAAVSGGVVGFEVRELKARKGVWSGRAELSMETFLAEASREVGCDHAG